MKSSPQRRQFKADRLTLVALGEQFQRGGEPPLRVGDVVQLNSGGPKCLLVDIDECNTATISWRTPLGVAHEAELPVACIHRIEVAD